MSASKKCLPLDAYIMEKVNDVQPTVDKVVNTFVKRMVKRNPNTKLQEKQNKEDYSQHLWVFILSPMGNRAITRASCARRPHAYIFRTLFNALLDLNEQQRTRLRSGSLSLGNSVDLRAEKYRQEADVRLLLDDAPAEHGDAKGFCEDRMAGYSVKHIKGLRRWGRKTTDKMVNALRLWLGRQFEEECPDLANVRQWMMSELWRCDDTASTDKQENQ
jgi:hypothetical protein